MEPALRCVDALYSPSTGIVDSHQYMLALEGDALDAGASIAFESPVTGGRVTGDGIRLSIGGAEAIEVVARSVVNCAGHDAAARRALDRRRAARQRAAGLPVQGHLLRSRREGAVLAPRLSDARSRGPRRARHARPRRAGPLRPRHRMGRRDRLSRRPGPRRAVLSGDPTLLAGPAATARSFPTTAACRPKVQAPHEPAGDFVIRGPRDHGVAGLVNLFGIESPGLTASLAIADHALAMLGARA